MVRGNIKKILAGGFIAACFMMLSTTTLTGCLTDDKKDADTTTKVDTTKKDTAKHTMWPTAGSFMVGAQAHATLGSAVDVDAGPTAGVLLSAAANLNKGKIDFVFAYDTIASKVTVYNGKGANDAGIKLAQSWKDDTTTLYTNLTSVKFVKVMTAPADIEAGVKAYAAGTAAGSLQVVKGDMFLLMSSMGKLTLVTVTDIGGTAKESTGTLTVSVSSM